MSTNAGRSNNGLQTGMTRTPAMALGVMCDVFRDWTAICTHIFIYIYMHVFRVTGKTSFKLGYTPSLPATVSQHVGCHK